MKKCEFYSMHMENRRKIAKLHSGYTDGKIRCERVELPEVVK